MAEKIDWASLLGNIGGALGAQATGGSQGLQAFMATVAQRDQQALAGDIKREMLQRQQAFTASENEKQRAHEVKLKKMGGAGDNKKLEYAAQGLMAGIGEDPAKQGVFEEKFQTIFPGQEIAWDNVDSRINSIRAYVAAAGPDAPRQIRAETADEAARRTTWAEGVGTAIPDSVSSIELAKGMQRRTDANNALAADNNTITTLSQALAKIDESSDKVGSLQALRTRFDEFSTGLSARHDPTSGEHSEFTSGPLSPLYGTLMEQSFTLNGAIKTALQSAQIEEAGQWDSDTSTFAEWPLFDLEALPTNKQWTAVFNSAAVRRESDKFDSKLHLLLKMDPAMRGEVFGDSTGVLPARLQALLDAAEADDEYDFNATATAYRTAQMSGDSGTDAMELHGGYMKSIISLPWQQKMVKAATLEHEVKQQLAVKAAVDGIEARLGISLSFTDAEHEKILKDFSSPVSGPVNVGSIYQTGGIPGTEFDAAAVTALAQGRGNTDSPLVDKITEALGVKYGGISGTITDHDAFRLAQSRLQEMHGVLGKDTSDKIEEKLQLMRKGSGFEDTAAPAELHNFNSPPVLDVTHSFSELIEDPDEEDKKLWAAAGRGGTPLSPRAYSSSVKQLMGIVGGAAERYDQPYDTYFLGGSADVRTFTAEQSRGYIEADPPGHDNKASFYDLMRVAADWSPSFKLLLGEESTAAGHQARSIGGTGRPVGWSDADAKKYAAQIGFPYFGAGVPSFEMADVREGYYPGLDPRKYGSKATPAYAPGGGRDYDPSPELEWMQGADSVREHLYNKLDIGARIHEVNMKVYGSNVMPSGGGDFETWQVEYANAGLAADVQTIQRAAKLDLIRGLDFSRTSEGMTPEQMAIMGQLQDTLRSKSVEELHDTFLDVGATGLNIDELGIDTAPTRELEGPRFVDEPALPRRPYTREGIQAHIEAANDAELSVATAIRHLEDMPGRILDMDADDDVIDAKIMSSELLAAEQLYLAGTKEKLHKLDAMIVSSPVFVDVGIGMADILLNNGNGVSDNAGLATALTEQAASILGQDVDEMEFIDYPHAKTAEDLGKDPDLAAEDALDSLAALFHNFGNVQMRNYAQNAQIPMADKLDWQVEKRQRLQYMVDQMATFSRMLEENPDWKVADGNSEMRRHLPDNFDSMPVSTSDERDYKGAMIWAALIKARGRD